MLTPGAPPPTVRRRGGRGVRLAAALLLAALVLLGVSVGRALAAPGSDSVAARLAEWGRSHELSSLIDVLERATYRAPQVGGVPAAGSPLARGGEAHLPVPVALPPSGLAPVQPVALPTLPGEGDWQVVAAVYGRPALQTTFLRPDSQHTSYTAGVVWMDPSLVRFALHPGTQEPGGGPWAEGSSLPASERPVLLGAFNGGFRLDAARGGFYEQGRQEGALRDGAASLVITADGGASVQQWGRDVSMSPTIRAVRQNLDLLVDHGAVVPGVDRNINNRWGATIGNQLYVAVRDRDDGLGRVGLRRRRRAVRGQPCRAAPALDQMTELRIHTCTAKLAATQPRTDTGPATSSTLAIQVTAAAAYKADVRTVAEQARSIARSTVAEQFGWTAAPIDIDIVDVYLPEGRQQ